MAPDARASQHAAVMHVSDSVVHKRINDDDDAFVRVSGTRFSLRGATWALAGANCHYLQSWASDDGCRAAVDAVLDATRVLGLNTLRCWAFNDGNGWGAIQTAPGVFCERGLSGLDYLIEGAAARGLRIILSLLNYWPEYGGVDQYLNWAQIPCACDDVDARRAAFYGSAECRATYVHMARTLTRRVNARTGVRYADEPAILAWELVNEPRCAEDNGAPLQAWLATMAPAVKALAPRQLVTVGLEGFFGSSTPVRLREQAQLAVGTAHGTDFVANCSVDGIDFASIHVWPDSWLRCGGVSPTAADAAAFAARWVRSHAAEAAARLCKPLLVSEFGTPDGAARAAFFATMYAVIERALGATDGAANDECNTAGDGTLAGSCLWMLAQPGYPCDGMEVTCPCAPLPAFCNAGVCSSGDNAANAAALAEIARHAAAVRAWNEAQHANHVATAQR